MLDYSKFILHSDCPSFKNDILGFTSLVVSGNVSAGLNRSTIEINVPEIPDYADLQFNGNQLDSGGNVVSSTAWLRKGGIYFKGNGSGYVDEPVEFKVYWHLEDRKIILNLVYEQQFTGTLALTPGDLNIRYADYSNT